MFIYFKEIQFYFYREQNFFSEIGTVYNIIIYSCKIRFKNIFLILNITNATCRLLRWKSMDKFHVLAR